MKKCFSPAQPANEAIASFRGSQDRPRARRHVRRPAADAARTACRRERLRFDPASGLFGLVPVQSRRAARQSRRAATARAGARPRQFRRRRLVFRDSPPERPCSSRVSTACQRHRPRLVREPARRPAACVAHASRPAVSPERSPRSGSPLPYGPGADFLLARTQARLGRDRRSMWSAAQDPATADFALIDEVAPSSSPAWFVRRFRCGVVPVCDPQADQLMDAARQMPVPGAALCLARAGGRAASTTRSCSSPSRRRSAGRWSRPASRTSPGTVMPVTRSPTWNNSRRATEMAIAWQQTAATPPDGHRSRSRCASASRPWSTCSNGFSSFPESTGRSAST